MLRWLKLVAKLPLAVVEPTLIYTIKSLCFALCFELVIAHATHSLYSLIINYTARIITFPKSSDPTVYCNFVTTLQFPYLKSSSKCECTLKMPKFPFLILVTEENVR